MRTKQKLIGALMVVSLALVSAGNAADEEERYGQPQSSREKDHGTAQGKYAGQIAQMKASQFIGKDVRNAQDENLGRIQDLVMEMESGVITVPYAIVAYGGALGIGSTKIAVPIGSLECSSDGKKVLISATKEEFQSASSTPSGAWSQVSGDWSRDIDGFFGQPTALPQGRFERQAIPGRSQPREQVRDPVENKGAHDLLNKPTTTDLNQKISACLEEVRTGLSENVQASVDNGVVTLRGEVDTQAQKQTIESKVTAIPGIQRVENELKVKNQ